MRLATSSARVTAEVVSANEFPDLADRFGVRGVPRTVVNDHAAFVGALPEAAFVEQVARAALPAGSVTLPAPS